MGYGHWKLARLGWVLLACGGCQARSDCCDYLPPVANGVYGPPGLRAGSNYLSPGSSGTSIDPFLPNEPDLSSTENPGTAHLTRLAPIDPIEPVASGDPDQPAGQMGSEQSLVSSHPIPYAAMVLPEEYHR